MRAFLTGLLLLAAPGLAASGERLAPEAFLPGHGAADAHAPVAAFGKDVFLVVWRAGMGEKADIVGIRLDRSGRLLDAKPFVISDAKDCQERPRVAFGGAPGGGGGVFLVVWQDLRNERDYDVYVARVTPEGKVLDAGGAPVSAEKRNQVHPAVCFDGRAFQIIWRDMRGGVDYAIYGGRISPGGQLLDGASGVLVHKPFQDIFTTRTGPPGIGSAGDGKAAAAALCRWLMAWGMAGGKATGKPVAALAGKGKGGGWKPAFASDGKRLLMTFTTYQPISRGGTIGGSGAALMSPDGSGLPAKIVNVTGGEYGASACIRNPSPVWDGSTYVVAWDIEEGPRSKTHWDAVYLRRISREGKPQGANTPVAGEKGSPAYHPAAASDGKGTTLIAYERGPKTANVPIKIGFRLLKK